MKRFLMPDFDFRAFDEATPAFLKEQGIRALILDIDNTLEPYENPQPGAHVLAWFSALREAGIGAAFVSNNDLSRVSLFNESLGLPAYAKAGKPFPRAIRKALADLSCPPTEAALMGDQIFTDVLAAHAAGLRAILVPPIRDKRDLLTRSKRFLERPILYFYRKGNH